LPKDSTNKDSTSKEYAERFSVQVSQKNYTRRIKMKKVPFAKYISCNTLIRSIAALSILSMTCMTAAAQLTLDSFPTGNNGQNYVKTLNTAGSHATHIEPLPAGSPLGAGRWTKFIVGPDPYAQANTIDVGNGIFIVETGFQAGTEVEIFYGVNLSGTDVPMGLNLSAYSALQLNFAALASTAGLDVIVEVWPSSGGYYLAEVVLYPTVDPFPVVLPYSSFNGSAGGTLTQTEASDINYIVIELEGAGSTESYGITSFQAVN
jgi:hypothetical protein